MGGLPALADPPGKTRADKPPMALSSARGRPRQPVPETLGQRAPPARSPSQMVDRRLRQRCQTPRRGDEVDRPGLAKQPLPAVKPTIGDHGNPRQWKLPWQTGHPLEQRPNAPPCHLDHQKTGRTCSEHVPRIGQATSLVDANRRVGQVPPQRDCPASRRFGNDQPGLPGPLGQGKLLSGRIGRPMYRRVGHGGWQAGIEKRRIG